MTTKEIEVAGFLLEAYSKAVGKKEQPNRFGLSYSKDELINACRFLVTLDLLSQEDGGFGDYDKYKITKTGLLVVNGAGFRKYWYEEKNKVNPSSFYLATKRNSETATNVNPPRDGMLYNLFITNEKGSFNILGIRSDSVYKVLNASRKGQQNVTVSGTQYELLSPQEIQIYTHDNVMEPMRYKQYCIRNNNASKGFYGYYLGATALTDYGNNVTNDFIGYDEISPVYADNGVANEYVSTVRLQELREIHSPDFDLTKLIQFCEELNDNYSRKNYLSVVMLVRSIQNHIAPIFGHKSFQEVANNYGTKSFQEHMKQLQHFLKNVADGHLHEQIRKKEILPTPQQVNFSAGVDVLLGEIVRKLSS